MIKLPPLPYDYNALEPVLPKHQVQVHYDKHTRKYYDTVNDLIKGTVYEGTDSLETIVTKKTLSTVDSLLFNNLAQAWNHTFFWNSLTPPDTKYSISDALREQIDRDFGSMNKLKTAFVDKANHHFGSGWCWITWKNGKLAVKTTPNAGTPLVTPGDHPLAVIDLWEHSYLYSPQYEADRTSYVNAVWTTLNWKFIDDNFTTAR